MTSFTPEGLSALLETSYTVLVALTEVCQAAEFDAASYRLRLAARRAEILVEFGDAPKVLGANEATREATREAVLSKMTMPEREDLAVAERELVRTKNELALQQLDIDHLRAQLRILEVLAGTDRRNVR